MAATPSSMLPLGTVAPDFTLPDVVSQTKKSLHELKSNRATVIMFICNHCPFVKHVRQGLIQLAQDYQPKEIAFVAISSNDAQAYPEDAPDKMRAEAIQSQYPFPYLYDENQAVAKAYDAACTPDFYVFDGDLKLVYRGQLDDSRPGNNLPVTGVSIRAALDAILSGQSVNPNQRPSLGCSIKWK
ncbi:thioredoxin family protein [candidate division KSB1 bacterium]|nr:thioredoxin family protein [candidate division KSB1 bacterium]